MWRSGHIHKPTYENEENIVYPGSMISFGFDELRQTWDFRCRNSG